MSSSEPEFNDAREYSSLEEVMNTLLTAKGNHSANSIKREEL